MDTLESLAHRGYTEGFYAVIRMMNTKIMITGILFLNANNLSANLPVNVMNKVWRKLRLNKFLLGDEVELMTPKGNVVFTIERMLNRKNEHIDAALGDGHFVFLDVPQYST